jgi:uracil-DNA glycosylase family 4
MTASASEAPMAVDPAALLQWYVAMGVDEAIGDAPVDRSIARPQAQRVSAPPQAPRASAPSQVQRPSAPAPRVAPTPAPAPRPAASPSPARVVIAGAADTRALAASCQTLAELQAAIHGFDGCALKATATNTVFADGNPEAALMVVGEGPGAEEDRLGLPFVGASGRLLDRMLGAIGLERKTGAYITNVVYWRPPGNRTPTPAELTLCLPFVQRHIALTRPKVLVFSGATAAKTLLERNDGITRFRGRWFDYRPGEVDFTIPVMPTFHPSYLLRTPGSKREAWRDFLAVKHRLHELGAL